MKKIGFSDKFGLFSAIIIGIFCFCCLGIYAFLGKDTIAYLSAVLTFLGIQVGFLYNKNKSENVASITTKSTDSQDNSQG